MAARAVGVLDSLAADIIAGIHDIAAVLMHMLMVPRVLAGSAGSFMRAVRRGCRPGELHGQHQQHEDDEPATHGRGF